MISLDGQGSEVSRGRSHQCYGPLCARCEASGIVRPARWFSNDQSTGLCHGHFLNHIMAELIVSVCLPRGFYETENRQDSHEASGCSPDDFCHPETERRGGNGGVRRGPATFAGGDKTASGN